jgi:predicted permease
MLETLLSIAPLFLLIILGHFLYRYQVANINWVNIFNTFTLKIGFPALIFSTIYNSKQNINNYQDVISVNSMFLLSLFLIGLFLLKNKQNRRTYIICLIFNNIAFLGIPILKRIYGNYSTDETSIIASTNLFFVFTLGVSYLEISREEKYNILKTIKLLYKNPLLQAIIVALLFQVTTIELPTVIEETINLIAQSVTPVVLLSIGIFTGASAISKTSNILPPIYFSILTLVITPLYFLGVAQFTSTDLKLSIMEAAMPVALAPFAMADSFGLNKQLISTIIVISTILAPFTLTIWHIILK